MSSSQLDSWRIREWFPSLDERAHERLRIFHIELLRWTKKINLISPASVREADLTHFADSILGAQIIFADLSLRPFPKELWDIGSGNGFPGVIAGILRPDLGIVCVESDERKAAFLKQLGMRLELDTLGVRQERAEKLPVNSIGVAICRGFAPLDRALGTTTKQFEDGGVFYSFKGAEWFQEVKDITGRVSALWENNLLRQYKLTFSNKTEGPERAIFKSIKKPAAP